MMKKLVVLLSFITILLFNCVHFDSTKHVTVDDSIHTKESKTLAIDDPINPKVYKKNRFYWL